MILSDSKISGALGRAMTVMLMLSVVFAVPAQAIPPERRRAEPPNYCRRLLVAGTMALAGIGLGWTSFESGPPQPLPLTTEVTMPAGAGRTAQAGEWEAVLDRGGVIEGRIPRTSKGFRAATLFANSTAHRMLADMARAQLAKAHPNLNFGEGPGISIPLDRLEIRREPNGDLYVVFISPLGELKSQSPIPSQALFAGDPLVASMGPLTIHGEAGATSTVEAAIQFRLDADEARLNVKEAIIRIRVKVPAFFVDQSDQTRVPALFAPLSPSK